MDNQHKKIADYVNHTLHMAINLGDVDRTIGFYKKNLLPYMEYHLQSEEEFMRSIEYPEYEDHKHRHVHKLKYFKNLAEILKDKESLKENTYNIGAFIYAHVGKVDKKNTVNITRRYT